jgi:hypothetical protein
VLGVRPGITPPVLLTAAADIVNPYSQQFSVGVEREMAGFVVDAAYLGSRGTKVLRSRNVNLRIAGLNRFGPVFGPIDPGILQDNRVESSASSTYHGLALTLAKRAGRQHLHIAYTLSKAIDDTTDFITDLQPANQLDLRSERALSSFDQRHRLVVAAVFQAPIRLTVAPIYTVASGRPFNLLLGFDANGDTQPNTDRPHLAGRNTGRGPGFMGLDLRIAREFEIRNADGVRLEGIVEVFNAFNRVNYSGVNNVVASRPLSSYHVKGKEAAPTEPLGFTSAFDPRQIQLGVKVRF